MFTGKVKKKKMAYNHLLRGLLSTVQGDPVQDLEVPERKKTTEYKHFSKSYALCISANLNTNTIELYTLKNLTLSMTQLQQTCQFVNRFVKDD